MKITVRVTRQARCQFGFYLLINGSRLRFSTKAKAIEACKAFLKMQRIQIVSVSEYSRRKSVRRQAPAPADVSFKTMLRFCCAVERLSTPATQCSGCPDCVSTC